MQRRNFLRKAGLGALGLPFAAWAALRETKGAEPELFEYQKEQIKAALTPAKWEQIEGRMHRHDVINTCVYDHEGTGLKTGGYGRKFHRCDSLSNYLEELFRKHQWWMEDENAHDLPLAPRKWRGPTHVGIQYRPTVDQVCINSNHCDCFAGDDAIISTDDKGWIYIYHHAPSGRDLNWCWRPATNAEIATKHGHTFLGLDPVPYGNLQFSYRRGDFTCDGMMDWSDLDHFMREHQVGKAVVDYYPETKLAYEFSKRFPGIVHLVKLCRNTDFEDGVVVYVHDDIAWANRDYYANPHTYIGAVHFRMMAEDIVYGHDHLVRDCAGLGWPNHPEAKRSMRIASRRIREHTEREIMKGAHRSFI